MGDWAAVRVHTKRNHQKMMDLSNQFKGAINIIKKLGGVVSRDAERAEHDVANGIDIE